jgi:hypothetical protein
MTFPCFLKPDFGCIGALQHTPQLRLGPVRLGGRWLLLLLLLLLLLKGTS